MVTGVGYVHNNDIVQAFKRRGHIKHSTAVWRTTYLTS